MGQVQLPQAPQSLILTSVDRLVASNADGGLAIAASHVVLLGENAGQNLGPLSYIYVIGADSLKGGLATVDNNGTTVYGAKNLSALTNAIPANLDTGPLVVMGYNIAPVSLNRMGGAVLIGTDMFVNQNPAQSAEVSGTVIIGNHAFERHTMVSGDGGIFRRLTAIGWSVGRGQAGLPANSGCQFQTSVMIGDEVAVNAGAAGPGNGNSVTDSVLIGSRALPLLATNASQGSGGDVIIGCNGGLGYRDGGNNVALGNNVRLGSTGQTFNIVIGANCQGVFNVGGTSNILLGASIGALTLQNFNVIIGAGADATIGPLKSKQFLLGILDPGSGLQNTIGYGDFAKGSLIVGNSDGTNRDLPGTNLLKVVNGTWNGTNPGGGGMLYSLAGEMHWVSTTGQDYAITPSASRGVFTVATLPLPAASVAGNTAFVTDALAPAFGAAVVGGGAVGVPVYFSGGAWNVG